MARINKIAAVLAVITMILALSAALIKYVRSNEIDLALVGAGVAIPAVVIAIALTTNTIRR